MLPLRWAWFWAACGWLWVAAILVSSFWPGGVPTPVVLWDKFEHATGYAVLMLWFAGLYPRERFLRLALWCMVLGVAVELGQGALTTTRTMDVFDVAANGVGIAIALLLSWLLTGGWALRVERGLGLQPS